MTGRYPISLGIQHDVFQPYTTECLDTTQHLLPEVVKSNGYATHMVGKWHLGYARWDCFPCRRGFDSWLGYTQGFIEYINHEVFDYVDFMECSDDPVQGLQYKTLEALNGTYSMYVYEERAKDIIEAHNDDKPLFLYLTLQSPHLPYYAPYELTQDCEDVANGLQRCVVQGMVRAIEIVMEGVINKLKSKGMWENTLLIWHSDNGGPDTGFNSNLPLRGFKQYLWEGGVRNPAFVYSPSEKIMPNRGTSNSLIHVSDWFDTIISVSGGWDNWMTTGHVWPNDLDSIDQTRHILYGEEGLRRSVMLHIDPVNKIAGYIRGDYKLLIGDQSNAATCSSSEFYPLDIECLDMSIIQLYNLIEDPGEITDLYEDKQDLANEMIDDLLKYLSHQMPMQCQLPTDSSGNPNTEVPWYLPWDSDSLEYKIQT